MKGETVSHPLAGYRVETLSGGRARLFAPDGTSKVVATKRGQERPAAHQKAAPAHSVVTMPPAVSAGRYCVVPRLRVPDDARRAAEKAADLCADELGITPRMVRWFDEATPARLASLGDPERFDAPECLGVYRPEAPNCIFIKTTDDARLAAEVAAHETYHRWQFVTFGAPIGEKQEATYETAARCYSDAFAFRYQFLKGGL
jgi:hypothetical protein